MRSLDTLSARHLARRRGRFALVLLGVSLGVAVVFAVLASTSADTAAMNRDIDGSVGRADAVVTPLGAGDAVLAPSTLARVSALPGVELTSPGFSFGAILNPPPANRVVSGAGYGSGVTVRGLDPVTAPLLNGYRLLVGRLPSAGAYDIAVPSALARRRGLLLGRQVALVAPTGVRAVRLVGILADSGPGLADGGSIAYTSLPTAQALDGRPGAYNGIEVVLRPGTARASWIPRARSELGDSVAVTNAADLTAQFRSLLSAINGAFLLISAIAVFVGGFLVFLTFSVAVAERTRIYGTLRALGALPAQVRRLVVVEAVLLGFAASLIGLVIGYGMATLSLSLTDHLLFLQVTGLGLPVGDAVISVVAGVAVCAVAAWLPGRRAARLAPVAAMTGGMPAPIRRARLWPAALSLTVGVVLSSIRAGTLLNSAGAVLVLLGAVLAIPALLRPLARLFGAIVRRLAPGGGDIAVQHLVKERSRSSYTLALVMIVLAMVLAVGASNRAMDHTLDQVLDRQAGSGLDLQVGAASAFDPSVTAKLARIPGVRAASPLEFGQTQAIRRSGAISTIPVTIVEPASYFSVSGFVWLDGSDDVARSALESGTGVLLADTTAQNLGLQVGGTLRLMTGQGVHSFRLAATYASAGTNAAAVLGTTDASLFGAVRPDAVIVRADAAPDVPRVESRILTALGPTYRPFITSAAAIRDQARSQIAGFYSIGYVLLAGAGLIGMLGLANTLVVSVLGRTREIGILRSTGVLRRQVRRMVLVEAEVMALVALALALPLAALLTAGIISGQRTNLGMSSTFQYPWGLVVPVGVAALVVAALASLVPARRAASLEPVAALRFD